MALGNCCPLWYLQPPLPTASQWYFISTGIVLRIWKGHYGWDRRSAFSARGGSKHGEEQRGNTHILAMSAWLEDVDKAMRMAVAGQDKHGVRTSRGGRQLDRTGTAIMVWEDRPHSLHRC